MSAAGAQRSRLMAALALSLSGCSGEGALILHAQGSIARSQHDLLFAATAIMLVVVVPVIIMAIVFAWRYRASNPHARYEPGGRSSRVVHVAVWSIPALVVAALGGAVWIYTHRLDPYRPLASNQPALQIEVVAQDWKWLFIYPGQNIAAVNELALPVGRPVTLKLTSDTVMNSFFIPALAGQIYAMAGMQTQLNVIADAPGRLTGRNVQYSGAGFSEQTFTARLLAPHEFDAWVHGVTLSPQRLDDQTYAALARPSSHHPIVHYSWVKPDLFRAIVEARAPARGRH